MKLEKTQQRKEVLYGNVYKYYYEKVLCSRTYNYYLRNRSGMQNSSQLYMCDWNQLYQLYNSKFGMCELTECIIYRDHVYNYTILFTIG